MAHTFDEGAKRMRDYYKERYEAMNFRYPKSEWTAYYRKRLNEVKAEIKYLNIK